MQRLLSCSSCTCIRTYCFTEICYFSLCGAAWCRPSVVAKLIMDNLKTSIVPYHDPTHDDSLIHISLFDENPTIDGDDLQPTIDENLTNLNFDFGVSDYDPYTDPVLVDISYNHLIGSSRNADQGNSNCQILREITHADGECLINLYYYIPLLLR